MAKEIELPSEEATLVTIRPDVDSIGAMAVLEARAQNKDLSTAEERIRLIANLTNSLGENGQEKDRSLQEKTLGQQREQVQKV